MSRVAEEGPRAVEAPGVGTRQPGRWGELAPRAGSAVVLMAAALGTAAYGGVLFDLFWLVASFGILWEWLRLVDGAHRLVSFASGAVALAGAAALTSAGLPAFGIALLVAGGVGLGIASEGGTRILAGLGLVYAGALVLCAVLLRHSSPHGRDAILFLFAVVWGTDSMAYFGGRSIGGPKLAPRFSPSKTWSGFLVGIGSGSLLGWAASPASGCVVCVLALGLVIGAVAQGGDILESMIKRRFNVKDAGNLIPGHGGLMDRLDGFLTASVLAVCLGASRSGLHSAGAGLFQW